MKTRTILDSVAEMFKHFESLDGVLFTSFAFSPDFFETYVLPQVIEECGRNTAAQIAATDEVLDKLCVAVLYDPGGLVDTDKRLSYEAIPIQMENEAIFHPKIIYCFGNDFEDKERHELLVASANLTRQGWGRNVEVVSRRTFLPGSYLGWDLSRFLEYAARKGNCRLAIQPFLGALSQTERQRWSEPQIRLIWRSSNEPDESKPLSAYVSGEVNEETKITICSPYFGDGDSMLKLLNTIKEKSQDAKIRLIPGPAQDGKFQIVRPDAEKILSNMPDLSWYRWKYCGEGNEYADRLVHAKMYILENDRGTWMAIGSHNFTQSGYGGRNIEASLWFPIEKTPNLDFVKLSSEELLSKCVENVEELSEAPKAVEAFCTVTINWKDAEFKISDIVPEDHAGMTIEIPWRSEPFPLKENEGQLKSLDEVSSALNRSRAFFIRGDGEILYRGIVNEIGWQDYRPEPPLSSIDDILDAWASPDQETENGKANAHQDKEDEQKSEKNTIEQKKKLVSIETHEYEGDLFDNYFYRFRAIRMKRDRLITQMDARKTPVVNRVLFKNRTSLKALVTRLDEQKSEIPKEKSGIPALTLGLVTLWELADLCAEAENRFSRLYSEINSLRRRINKLGREYKETLIQIQGTLDRTVQERLPFKGIDPDDVIEWFKKRLDESEKWEAQE